MGKKAKQRKQRERDTAIAAAPGHLGSPRERGRGRKHDGEDPVDTDGPRRDDASVFEVAHGESSPPPADIATRLNSVAIHLLRRLAREDTRLGLSGARLSALSVLVFGGPRTLGKLADAEGVSPPSMTRLVNAMESEGLVLREKNAADGRSVIIKASPEGERILVRGREQRVEALAGWLSAVTARQLLSLDNAMNTLEDLLQQERSDRSGTATPQSRP